MNRFTEKEKKALKIVDDMIGDMPIFFWEEYSDDEEVGEAWSKMVHEE